MSMAATSNDTELHPLRPAYVRAPSTDSRGFDGRTDTDEESGTLQTLIRHEALLNPEEQNVSHPRLFLRLFSLWIGTLLLTASVVALVYGYQAKGVLTPAQKSNYNVLLVVFILALGFSFFEAFKQLARHIRGRISRVFLADGKEQEFIRGFDRLSKVTELIFVTSKWRLRAFCMFWLAINLGAQMLTALISFEVTVEDGHDYNGTYTRAGKAKISKIDCIYHGQNCPTAVTIHALANVYGGMALGTKRGDYDDIPGLLKLKKDVPIWRRHDGLEFAHRFNEYNENDTQKAYPHLTERVITASSSGCIEYDVDKEPPKAPGPDPNSWRLTYRNQSFEDTIDVPDSAVGREGTTYIYRGFNVPAKAGDSAKVVCGGRCMYVWVYKNPGDKDGPMMYQCPITFSDVTNSKIPEHIVPNSVARVLAVSIALQGRFFGPAGKADFRQYRFYARGAPLEIHYYNSTAIASRVAEFAIGSLSAMIERNPKILRPGSVPSLGSHLTVESPSFAAILICLVATHSTVFTLTYMLARPRA